MSYVWYDSKLYTTSARFQTCRARARARVRARKTKKVEMKRKVNLLPNVVTAFSLCCGLFAIFKINMTPVASVNRELLTLTAGILLLAAFADLLDGALARAMKAESEFGGFFDSMADAVTFGVAPSVIVLKSMTLVPGNDQAYLMTTAAMVYSLCGVLRLVRFTVTSQQIANDQELKEASNKNFTGLPIPAAAAAIVSGNLFLLSEELQMFVQISHETRAWILFTMMILIGYFMISRWKFLSLKTLRIRMTSFYRVFLIALFTVFVVFYGLIQHFSVVFFIGAWGYVVVAWILSIIRLVSGKKIKTLEDFEPEPDEIELE